MQYLKYRIRTKLLRLFGPTKPAEFAGDDFDWRAYSAHYAEELTEVEQDHTTRLSPQDYMFAEGRLTQQSSALPLHPNHRLLYETLLQLRPASVLEMGCGGGDHLYNLGVLAPPIRAAGVDRSPEQLALLKRRSPNLSAAVSVADIMRPLPDALPPVDIAYTQAVIMHIQTGDLHLTALANAFQAATKQVVLMENWQRHPFLSDIRGLHAQGRIPWETPHFYFRRAPEMGGKPHLMVVSATPLDYEPLADYDALLSGIL
jgi:SAM-dependent methyltransferase